MKFLGSVHFTETRYFYFLFSLKKIGCQILNFARQIVSKSNIKSFLLTFKRSINF